MIGELTFGPRGARVRAAHFVPRPHLPLEAACLVAGGVRETLRDLLGSCELVIGEPVAVDTAAWTALTRDAYAFVTRGRQTDVVLVLPRRSARALVLRAFGEDGPIGETACSALEAHALERIAARCAAAFDPLCAQRHGPAVAVAAPNVPACVAVFDVRVRAPVALTLGIGIVRELPDPGPSGRLAPSVVDDLAVEVRAEFATGRVPASAVAALRVGSLVRLETKVGSAATLKVANQRIAGGSCGVRGAQSAFLVTDVPPGAIA